MRSAGCGLAFLGASVKSLRGKDAVGLAFNQRPCPLLLRTLERDEGAPKGEGEGKRKGEVE